MKTEEKNGNYNMKQERKQLTQKINKLQRKHPGTRRQRTNHGCGIYSVQFFDKLSGELKADYSLE